MFNGLWQSRKFRALVIDGALTLLLYFVGKYVPWLAEDINVVIVALQPIFIAYVVGTAYEDGQAKRMGGHPAQLEARAANSSAQVMSSPNDYAAAVGEPESAGMAVEIDPAITTLTEDIAQGLGA